MTDDEILFNKYEVEWPSSVDWVDYIKTISTNDLIRIVRIEFIPEFVNADLKELKTRTDTPEEFKLEVLLLLGDSND